MTDLMDEFKQIQDKMKKLDEVYKRKLLFMAFLNKCLREVNSRIIILGGFAVQFYLAGEYLTHDIDLACDNRSALKEILKELNFKNVGRYQYSEDLGISIEIPASNIAPNQEERLFIVIIEGYEIPILGIEDIVIDRLNAYTHWKSLEDGRLAKELIYIHYETLDWDYLETQARQEKVYDKYLEMKEEINGEREKD
jgi:predicted nucleotidyltransferase